MSTGPNTRPSHSIVIPCHNEANRLQSEAVRSFVDTEPNANVVLVNDCSTDATSATIHAIAESRPDRVRAVDRPADHGSKAEAVRLGVLTALDTWDDDWVGFLDADLSTPFEELATLFEALEENPDLNLITAARVKLFGRTISRSAARHYFGRVFATIVSVMFDLEVYDTQCGAKLIRRDLAASAFEPPFVSKWLFDVELILRSRAFVGKEGFANAMAEVPLYTWVDGGDSRIRPTDFLRVPVDLVRIKLVADS